MDKSNFSEPKNAARVVLLFTFLAVLPPALDFLLLPIYLNYYQPDEYALLVLLNIIGGFYGAFCNLKLDAAMRTNYFDYLDSEQSKRKYTSSIFSSSIVISFGILLLFLFFSFYFFDFVFENEALTFYPYVLLVIVSVFIGQFSSSLFIYLKNEYKFRTFGMYVLMFILFNILFQSFLIIYLKIGILGAIIGMLIARCLLAVIILIRESWLIDFSPNKEMVKKSLQFSIPFIPFVLLNWFFMNGDRILLERLMDLDSLGKYALLISIVGMIRLIFSAMDSSFRPYLYRYFKLEGPEIKLKCTKLLFWYLSIGLASFSGILLIGSNLNWITDNQQYLEVVHLFPLACLVMVPKLFGRIPALILVYLKKSTFISWSTFISLILLVILFFTLIPQHGLRGALYAIGIMNIAQFLLYTYSSTSILKSHFHFKDQVSLSVFVLMGSLGMYVLQMSFGLSSNNYGWIQFFAAILVIGCFYKVKKEYKDFII